ncbi:MAG TPA: hypothetical protein VF267_07135 [Gammaproteobacteria bacterium]
MAGNGGTVSVRPEMPAIQSMLVACLALFFLLATINNCAMFGGIFTFLALAAAGGRCVGRLSAAAQVFAARLRWHHPDLPGTGRLRIRPRRWRLKPLELFEAGTFKAAVTLDRKA